MSRSTAIAIIGTLSILSALSCRKEGGLQDDGAIVFTADTLHFDTVFTTVGSVTHTFRIVNTRRNALRIAEIRLAGGTGSAFSLNVDGVEGSRHSNLEIAGKDSLHLFVTVRINPGASDLPFLVRDSIITAFEGQERRVQLEAYGQQANFIRNGVILRDTLFNAQRPYVILGPLRIAENATLRIEKGTRMHFHADAPMIVDGTLVAEGTSTSRVLFTGDRLDEGYRDLPASWPGIYFRGRSVNNSLRHAEVRNAFRGLVADQPAASTAPKLELRQCIIDNAYEGGIVGINTSIRAVNCQVSNCGSNLLLVAGGDYQFTHCTMASYSTVFLPHKYPVMEVSDWDSTSAGIRTYPLRASFVNNILWGEDGSVDNEVVVSRRGSQPFEMTMQNNLFRGKSEPLHAFLKDNIRNQPPLFDSINTQKRAFDFRIRNATSPAVNRGRPAGIPDDLDGTVRDALPDIGCFERK